MKHINKKINSPKNNVVLMIVGMLVSMIITINIEVSASANIGAILLYIYPPFITIIAIVIFFFSRIFIKKHNWIISIICLIININFTYVWYFDAI